MQSLSKRTASVDIVPSGIDANRGTWFKEDAFEKDNPRGGVSQMLITALTNFIVPLIHGNLNSTAPDPLYKSRDTVADNPSHPSDGGVCNAPKLTIEAQELLVAIRQFAISAVPSLNGQPMKCSSTEKLDSVDPQCVSSHFNSPAADGDYSDTIENIESEIHEDVQTLEHRNGHEEFLIPVDMERQKMIQKIIDNARDMVFNKMPIRLLIFDKDGKGIRLVKRSEIMRYISSELNSVTNLELPYHHPFERYAILSHTWLTKGEITYSEWSNHAGPLDTQSPGYIKLAKFCEIAAKYGLRLAWMDTVCINKENSAELDESIRSMFKWYTGAKVCVAYLAETTSAEDMDRDKWFTRGWTLQELIAPRHIKFFSKDWAALSNNLAECDKTNFCSPLIPRICAATGLDEEELLYSPDLNFIPIWRKMQWAAKRKVTREEDIAYSLMGIFNISMPTGYGEGAEHAFLHLVREILSSKLATVSKLEIANWTEVKLKNGNSRVALDLHSNLSSSALIPKSPEAYMHSLFNSNIHFYPSSQPIMLSYMGLCVPVLLMPSNLVERHLNTASNPKGNYSGTVYPGYADPVDLIYKVLDGDLFTDKTSWSYRNIHTIGVLNIADETNEVLLPANGRCLAIKLVSHTPLAGWEIPEDLRFEKLGRHFTFSIVYHDNSSIRIPKDELSRHGMTLRTMYL